MRTLFLILILTLFSGIFMQVNAQTSKTYTAVLKVGKQKTVTPDKIKIQFLSLVEDSRCPTDAQCVWAGNAKIKVKISNRRDSQIVEMNTTTGGPLGASFDGYAINLTSLTPKPKSNIRISKNGYTATFEIRRLTR